MNLNSWIEDFCIEVKTKFEEDYGLTDQLRITDQRKASLDGNRVDYLLGYIDRELSVSLFERFRYGHRDKELQIGIKLIEFKSDKDFGFTTSRSQAIRLALHWLSYKQSYQQIFQEYNFLGGPNRLIKDLKNLVFKETLKYKNQLTGGRFELRKGGRSVSLATDVYGSSKVLKFYYKGIVVFEHKPDDGKAIIAILEAWLERKWSPEKIKESFTGIERVRHKELFMNWKWVTKKKKRFIKSWDSAEGNYEAPVIRAFIHELRSNNYDQKTRAGNVLGRLVISRSKEYGLRVNQKRISFDFNTIGPSLTMNTIDGRRLDFEEIRYNEVIKEECKRLLKEPVN